MAATERGRLERTASKQAFPWTTGRVRMRTPLGSALALSHFGGIGRRWRLVSVTGTASHKDVYNATCIVTKLITLHPHHPKQFPGQLRARRP